MRRNFIFLLTALMLLITNAFSAFGQTQYEKVTSALTDGFNKLLSHNDLARISDTAAVMIVDVNSSRALSNANGASSAPTAVPVTINNDVIGDDVDETLLWNVHKATDGYIFTVKGDNTKWLYSTNSNNGVRIGDNAANIWTVDIADGDYHGMKHNETSRFIGVYNNQDWRTYTTVHNNIKNTQIEFFIKGELPEQPQVSKPEFSPEAGTYTEAQNITISCETEGATIYYTTDGTTPDTLSTIYSEPISISTTTTVKAIAMKEGLDNSSVATATYTIEAPLTTMDEIFAKATAAGSTATDVTITFNNWVVTGVAGSNAYLTDGVKGLIIYGSGHGFTVGDHLTGTASCKVQLYQGSSELTSLKTTTTGLTVTPGTTVEPVVMTIDQITSGVYTGAVITISNVSYDGTDAVLSDGTNTIKPFNKLYSGMSFTDGESYNVTGLYLQYNAVKEIMPRNADDIELVQTPGTQVATPTFSPEAGTYTEAQNVTISCETEGATIYYTTNGSTPDTLSSIYYAPISISATTTVKAVAMKEGLDNSNIATATYTIEVPQSGDFGLVSKASDITTDGTYLLVCVSAGTAATNSVSSSALQTSSVTITNNVITTGYNTDGKPYAVTIETATGGYYIKLNNGKYINNASSTSIAAGETASSVWAFNSYEGGMIAQNTSNSNRFLGGATAAGATYKAYAASNLGSETNPVVMLFKKDLTPSVESVATPTFSPEAGTYTEAQTVTISCETEGATIFYTTDGTMPDTLSTIYSEPISISTTTTVKAIAMKEGLDNSEVSEAEYVINTTPVTDGFNKLLSHNDLARISDTTEVMIVDVTGSMALTSANGTNSAPTAVAVAINDDVISGDVDEALLWNVHKVTDGYIFTVKGDNTKWLYTTDANNGVRVGTNEANIWTVDIVDGNYHGMKHNGTNRYIGVYNSQDWRAYTTVNNNIKNTQIEFFINGELPEQTQVTKPEFSIAAGTYTEPFEVAISCSTEGATIYYTTDGTTPTSESTVYSEPISISETTTVKAVAMKAGLDNSEVAEARYVIPELSSIISARHLSSGDVAIVEGVVTFIDSRNIYIEDTTAAIVLYLNSNTVPDILAIGDKVKAMGTYDVYNGLVELKNIDGNDETQFKIESKGNELPLTNATVGEILNNGLGDYQAMRVKISNAVIGEINTSGNTTLTQNGETVNIYKIPALETISAGANVNVTSVISCFNTIQLRVADANDVVEVVFTATPTALNLFSYSEGFGPSQSQIVTICTKNLENDVTISTGDAFEITKDSIFSHTTTIPAGYNDVTVLSVRLADGLSANTYRDTLNISTATFEDIKIVLNGEVSIPGAVETPIISPVSGAFDDPFSVTISCATEGATIYYTTDGTTPDISSDVYSAPFTVNQNTVVKAVAMKEDMINSNIATAEYTFNSMLYADTESLNFSYVEGEGPSSESSVVLTGKNIFADVVNISVSGDFEVSLDHSAWNSSETIVPTSAFAVNSTIYVRLKANLAKDEYDGSMTIEADGVEAVTVTLHGVVSGPAEPWHRISSIDELLDGKRIIIAARHNSTENEFVAVEGKVSNKINGILFEATEIANEMYIPEDLLFGIDTIAWTVGINDGIYTFTNGSGNMLGYSSGTNFGSSANTNWTVEYAQSGEGTMVPEYFGYVIKNAESTSRAVALNTSDKFGAYSTQNLGSADYNFYLDIFMEGQGAAPTVAKPVFNPASGIYYDDIDLEIMCGTPGAEIHYTLDGTEPDESSAVYTGTIVLSEDATTVKAIAYKEGYNASAIAEASYIIDRTITMILEQDWENGWKEWSQVNSGDGDAEWTISSYSGNKYAYINGYNHGSNEVYLISPTFNLNEYVGSNIKLSFRTAQNYSEDGLEVLFSNNSTAGWIHLPCELSSGNAWTWVESGDIDMNSFSGENCTIMFRYTCNEDNASAWEIDDIRLWAEASDEPFCKVIADLDPSSFSYVEGHGPSAAQQYSFVYGNMEAGNDIVIYASDEVFELSLDGENFYNEINLTTTDEMTTVPVFIRLAAGIGAGDADFDDWIYHICGGITTVLEVSGHVYPGSSVDENEAFSVNIWNAKNVIVIENENDESIDMTIYNIAGQPVMRVENIDGTQRIGHSLNSGAYIVRVNGTKKVKSQTIIVE